MRVDQVIPSLASRDAIGVSALNLRDGLRRAGIDSDIFYGSFTPDVEHEGRPVTELGRAGRDRWLLYQASIGSPVYDILAARSEPKLVNYHNITPAALLRDWEPNVAYEASLGRTQLGRLAPQSRFAVADSAFNESELLALGYEGTAVVPLLIDMHAKSEEPDPALAAQLAARRAADGGSDLLYVGKISPHKAPHDLVKMLDVLRRTDDPAARLHLVGSPLGTTYEPALRAFIAERGLDDAVLLPGSVTGAELEAYLRAADVFVTASDHEGFCVPLAEAMGHGVPIVAYGVTAVPETVGGRRAGAAGQVARGVRGRGRPGAARRASARRPGRGGPGAGRRLRPGRLDRPLRHPGARRRRGLSRPRCRCSAAGLPTDRRVNASRRRAPARVDPGVGR